VSNGTGCLRRDPIFWAWVDEDGRVVEHGKFRSLARDEAQREAFVELLQRKAPDVIAVSGFSSDTYRLVKDLETLVNERGLVGDTLQDPTTDEDQTELLEVVVVNDEVARLYKDSQRAAVDHPTFNPAIRYCVALAKYMQSPMKEYAALGENIMSLSFHPYQQLLPQDKLQKCLETAMVDIVNMCGVDINEAINNSYTANLLPYVAGLGPRKATSVIKAVNANGGVVGTRGELVGDPDSGKLPVVGPRVWNNCSSFLYIEYDIATATFATDPMDNTRVHPEDYELGRKMAADALEIDEEDVKVETDENGPAAVVRKLFQEGEQEKVNELILEEYAEQLERNYNQRKRATLELIRAELLNPFQEIRNSFAILSPDTIFTMFTSETKDSLYEGMIISVNVCLVKDDFATVKLDCGIEGRIELYEISSRYSMKEILQVGQTIQAKLIELNRKEFTSMLSVGEDALQQPYKKHMDYEPGAWDFKLEDQDKEDLREKGNAIDHTQRVIKHHLFKPFNATRAEEYLGSKATGEVIIRPSSKGNDHLAITWKIAEGVIQHIDVLELDKENEFSVGRTLCIGTKYTYSDLDELIIHHVKAMANKVDELTRHDKFQKGTKADVGKFLHQLFRKRYQLT
jgi:transcription elongation factor SPT6